jgi:phosphoribosyl 1,2-cyclic phosphate phosphodiesterase
MAFDGPIRITVLGSGTSVGVPTVGCPCAVCRSDDPRDKRLRPSVLVSYEGGGRSRNVLIDTTPDLRQQALTAGFTWIDAILFTHAHADHIMGLDDIRPFNYGRPDRIPAYGTAETLGRLRDAFSYAFEGEATHAGGRPRVEAAVLNASAVDIHGLEFHPLRVWHGRAEITAFRFGNAAYVTDQSDIPSESLPLLEDLDVLFLGALRREPHPTHSTVDQALAWVERLRPRRAYFTHICHHLPHAETNAQLPGGVELAYDGLVIDVAPKGSDV